MQTASLRRARHLLEKASEAFEQRRWKEAVPLFEQVSQLYRENSSEQPGQDLESAAIARLTKSFATFTEIISSELEDSDRALQLSRSVAEDLRIAIVLFEKAGLEEEAKSASGLLEMSRARFYQIHGQRQLHAYNNEHATKYLKDSGISSDMALEMFLQASQSRLLDRERSHETIRNLTRQSSENGERIESLERALVQSREELAHYTKQPALPKTDHEAVIELKALAKMTRNGLRHAKLSLAVISVLIVLVLTGLIVTAAFHVPSVFYMTLAVSATWAASTIILILKESRQLRTTVSGKMLTS